MKLRKRFPVRVWIHGLLFAGCISILALLFLPQFREQTSTVRSALVVGGMAVVGMVSVLWLWTTSLKATVHEQTDRMQNDLDKLQAAEAALRVSESRLREAQQLAHLGHWFWDVNSGAVEWSDEVYKIFQLDPEEFTPQIDSILALSPWPEDYQRDQELIQRATESREAGSYEQKFLRPNGSTGYYFSTFQGIYDGDGGLTAIRGTVQDITERRKAQDKIKESESMYRMLVESANSFVFSLDAQGRFDFVNRFWTEKVGYSAKEIIGANGFDLITPESRKKVEQEFAQVLRGDFVGGIEFRSRTKDKGFIDVLINLTPICDSSGQVTHMLGTGIDITDRKRAQDALHREKEFTDTALDAQLDTFFLFEPAASKALRWNRAFRDISGYTNEEIARMPAPASYYDPQDLERAEALIQKVMEEGTGTIEMELICKNGRKIPTEYRVSVINDDRGEPKYLISIGRDITKRKQAEQALRESESRLSVIFNHSSDLQLLLSVEPLGRFRVAAINQGYINTARQYGLDISEQDCLEKTLEEMVLEVFGLGQTVLDYTLKYYRQAVELGQPVRYEEYLDFEAGRLCSEVTIVPVLDDAGDCRYVLWTSHDITERKQAEAKICELNEQLEQRVVERTAELKVVNKELEAFSYSVSHDLRAPLRAIDGFTRILVEDYESALDAEGQRVCAVIRRQSRQMGQLIDDLLAFSRLSRVDMWASSIDMEALANAVFCDVTTSTERERIDFQQESLPPVVGDPTLIRQVWINLLSNAVKFSAKRKRAVIKVGGSQDADENVYFVRDNGAGFDMQYADKLFGVFQRLHSEREFEGTGVGLAIIQRVLHRHGGRIWAEAEEDKGATFYFALPRKGA